MYWWSCFVRDLLNALEDAARELAHSAVPTASGVMACRAIRTPTRRRTATACRNFRRAGS